MCDRFVGRVLFYIDMLGGFFVVIPHSLRVAVLGTCQRGRHILKIT